ncbi:MAG: hypothetical protein ACIARR_05940 [Phycisphaerales bacterium JB059]
MPVDAPHQSEAYREIDAHRPCHRCGYDLRGLDESAVCPECGAPIRARQGSSRFADNLTDAPLEYLRWLSLGFALLSLSIIVISGAAAYATLAAWGAPVVPAPVLHGAMLVSSFVWFGGVWIATFKRPIGEHTARDALLDSRPLRRGIRALQVGTPLAAVLGVSSVYAPLAGAAQVFGVLAGVCAAACLLAMIPLCVYLSSLADWAGDSGVGERLRGAAWSLAIFGPITTIATVLGPSIGAFKVVAGWGALFVFLGACLFASAILQLAVLSMWAVRNHISGAERDSRLAEMRRRERMEREARIEAMSRRAQPEGEAPAPADDGGEPIPIVEEPIGAREIRHGSEPLPRVTKARPSPEPDRAPTSLPDLGEEHYEEFRIDPKPRDGA